MRGGTSISSVFRIWLVLRDLCALAEGPDVNLFRLAAEFGPGPADCVLGDAGQEEGEPAEQDVGADPVLAPVEDWAQVDDMLHCARLRGTVCS